MRHPVLPVWHKKAKQFCRIWIWENRENFFFQKSEFYSIILAVFYCSSDIDCNNKGICNNGECDCNPGWDEELDCTGNIALKVE